MQASHSLGGLAESGKEGIRVDCICPSFADTTLVTDNQVAYYCGKYLCLVLLIF